MNWKLRLIAFAKQTPYRHLDGYMMRYWVIPPLSCKNGENCGPLPWKKRPFSRILQHLRIAVRVHNILRSDLDRDPHSHPWPFLSRILLGEYVEEIYNDQGKWVDAHYRTYWHKKWVFRTRKTWHKVIQPQNCWTLVITFGRHKGWAFNVDGKVVPAAEYNSQNAPTS